MALRDPEKIRAKREKFKARHPDANARYCRAWRARKAEREREDRLIYGL